MSKNNNLTSDDFKLTSEFTPEEYKKNWSNRLTLLFDDYYCEESDKVFEKLYKHIWELLFGPDATAKTLNLAVQLIEVQRSDAAYYNPYVYNDWIRMVKDEIIKREMFDLWTNEFVTKRLGLYGAPESEYFKNPRDPEIEEFYKINGVLEEAGFEPHSDSINE